MKPQKLEITIFNINQQTAETFWNLFVKFLEASGFVVAGIVAPLEWETPIVDVDETIAEQDNIYNTMVEEGIRQWKR